MKNIFIAILIISQVGCSSIIYGSGKHSSVIRGDNKAIFFKRSREDVREELGEPERIEIIDGSECDIFIIKGMIADHDTAEFCFIANGTWFFIPEIYCFPRSIYDLPGRIKGIHELTIYYSDEGVLIKTELQKIERHSQSLEPTVKTPVESVNVQGTTAEL
jgi:hypothetical protein